MMLFNIQDNMIEKPEIIVGDVYNDQRGSIEFVNNFKLDDIKRFYAIEPANLNIVKAWQAHKEEQKWFYVIAGSFKIVIVKIDNWESPSNNLFLYEFNLNADRPEVLHIPGGYANGFKSMEPNSKVIIFSNFTVKQSASDDYRFDQNNWFDWSNVN